ncbi:hypothetical protein LH991_12270 [Schleiferilactobacillus harbinensis]|uniref:Transposase n=1 Tax=Schleiferilactobacillus harbinensis TaxID=304207 RepID=A0ABU7T3R2_9LACO|nr:hypothetical protein [Schleiferilactobacillus harbinensis]QFR64656.1 hypothetical protein LH991_12270 [Schleiferilactobacillus harbinensis]
MVQIKDIVPIQVTDRSPKPLVKPQVAARVKLKDAEVVFYTGVDRVILHVVLQELTGNVPQYPRA